MFEKHTTVETRLEQFRELRKSNLSMKAVVERFGEIKPCNRYLLLNKVTLIPHLYPF